MQDPANLLKQAQLLISRLERMSADSIWARRSSGYRGSLLRWVERVQAGQDRGLLALDEAELARFELAVRRSYDLLEKAAREMTR